MSAEISRRFFLGGAISLAAVVAFEPKPVALANMPTIYGDGRRDDSHGLGALFRNEPVIFARDKIGIEEHGGIIIHGGEYLISTEVYVPNDVKLQIIGASFLGRDLPPEFSYFNVRLETTPAFCNNIGLTFKEDWPRRRHSRTIRTRNAREDIEKAQWVSMAERLRESGLRMQRMAGDDIDDAISS